MAPAGPLRIAHGFGNRRKLVQVALKLKIDVIEGDVRLRAGGLRMGHERRLPFLPILLERRPSNPLVRQRALALGPWQARLDVDPFSLEELLEIVGGRRGLLLDLKCPRRENDILAFAETLAGLLRRYTGADTVRLCGDWPLLDMVREVMLDCRAYYSVGDRRRWHRLVSRVKEGDRMTGVSLRAALLDESTAHFLHDRGVEVFCWRVDSAREAKRVADLGVDGIIGSNLAVLIEA